MCGIAGIVEKNKAVDQGLLKEMLIKIIHRGPEDEGIWFSKNGRVGLGHRRLAIIDLSPGGHQPMISSDGNFTITFNGEIYNYQELRKELSGLGWNFHTESDTEVLLYSYIQWREKCLDKLNGMFAFAIWDEAGQELFAARDRLGEKPFKYYYDENRFIFASELKAILADKTIRREVDWQAIDLAMTYRYVPSPRTGFVGIQKLPAGHKLTLKNHKLEIKPFWQPADHAKENFSLGLEEWKKELWDLFKDSVKKRMISDVPVGAFLSGGLDSSSVVAAMSEITGAKVKTFAVGFKDRPDSETPFAKLVADRYKTDHSEIIIDPNILETLPQLIYHYEEPFFDNSAIPTMAMAHETKKHVTVVLTGDGGDECFGGYPSYTVFKYLNWYHKLPKFVYHSAIPKTLGAFAGLSRNKKLAKLYYRSELLAHPLMQAYVDYYGIWQKELDQSKFYLTKHDLYTDEFRKAIDINLSEKLMAEWMALGQVKQYGTMNRAMLADMASRLGDNYLVKVDIASMIYALESRPPFLDHRLVEAALALPDKYKIKGGTVKWIWKEIMKDKLPETIITRRKMGFGIPITAWMRDELYDYLHGELISNYNGVLYDHLNKKTIEQLLEYHKDGKADYSNHLWSILLLKYWLKEFFGS